MGVNYGRYAEQGPCTKCGSDDYLTVSDAATLTSYCECNICGHQYNLESDPPLDEMKFIDGFWRHVPKDKT